jgi:mannose-6-phosphate isomerase
VTTSALRLPPNLLPRFYAGGPRSAALRDLDLPPDARSPEEWIASTVTVHGSTSAGLSRLADGSLLRERVLADPVGYLGAEHVRRFGDTPALLVKLLDAGERLPVHFHPPRPFARRHLGSEFGKTECWIVLDAEPGATVHLGFAAPADRREVLARVAAQDAGAMLAALNELTVTAGDVLFVPAGTPHAIGAGVLILELQEPTDFSVLLEWRSLGVGEDAAHLGLGWERALEALDTSPWDAERLRAARTPADGLLPHAAAAYFRAQELHDGDEAPPAFRVVVVVEGAGRLQSHAAERPTAVRRGDVLLVPHAAGAVRLEGDACAICCAPPA